jgi:hypothetical protein
MDIMENNRIYIKKFIRGVITEYDIGRSDDGGRWQEDIEELYKLNDNMIDKSCDSFILWLIQLIKLIKEEKINNMDKEYMVSFPTSGFCWNAKCEFIIFNER